MDVKDMVKTAPIIARIEPTLKEDVKNLGHAEAPY